MAEWREPLPSQGLKKKANPYEGRWRAWYSSIADWMLANPGRTQAECAAALGKGTTTIGFIMASDTFKQYFAARRAAWSEVHDRAITQKLTAVTEAALDSMLDQFEKKKDQIPLQLVTQVATSGLDRLGFGPKTVPPAVNVNVSQTDNRVQIAVSAADLAEAQSALRLVEARRALENTPSPPSLAGPGGVEVEGEAVVEAAETRDEDDIFLGS